MAAANYKVDTAQSRCNWSGYKVTGKHMGHIQVKNGDLQMDNGRLIGGSFEIDMNTIACTDLEGEWAAKLVGHLKSDDFFGTAKYPTAKLVITRALPQDNKGNHRINADLTIKEITKPVRFSANILEKEGQLIGSGKITIDRSEYNIRYGSSSFFDALGDKAIYDEFDLDCYLVAKK